MQRNERSRFFHTRTVARARARISKEGIRRCSRFAESTCRKYGHFEGVVTNADILEAIVGEFRTDEGPVEPDAVQRDDGSWLIAGSMPVDEMGDRLSMTLLPERNYHTAAGFALNQLGHLPPLAKASIIKAGVSRSSISMAVALTRFWLDGLARGGGEQRSNAECRSSKSDGTSAGIALWKRDTVW